MMSNRWYKKNFIGRNPHCFYYRNSRYVSLLRQIKIEYHASNEFSISIRASSIANQQKILACFKTILTEDEFKNNFYCLSASEISINTHEYIQAGSAFLEKMMKVFEQIHKIYPEEISVEVIKELKNLFKHNFNTRFVSEIPTWQENPSYVNPRLASANHLARLTTRFYLNPKEINPASYLPWLEEGENPNQKDSIGRTLIFILADFYSVFVQYGVQDKAYNLIQLITGYGGDIFNLENGPNCMSAAEKMDQDGYPGVFRGIINANIRVERPLNIKSSDQRIENGKMITEFKFHDKKKDTIVTRIYTIEEFNKNKNLVEKTYALFSQTFEDPDGSMMNVKNEFDKAFSPDTKSKVLVEMIYAENNNNLRMIGCALYKIRIDSEDAVLDIDYAFNDEKYRFGLMTLLVFRIGFCLAVLNPNLQSAVHFSAIHFNSWAMLLKEMISPKFNVLGAERVFQKMLGDNIKIKTFLHEEALRVKGTRYTRPLEDVQQMLFYTYFMQSNKLMPSKRPLAVDVYAPITQQFFKRTREAANFHGIPYDLFIKQFIENYNKLYGSTCQATIPVEPYVFPNALSFFAPPTASNDSQNEIPQIRSKL